MRTGCAEPQELMKDTPTVIEDCEYSSQEIVDLLVSFRNYNRCKGNYYIPVTGEGG